jgi:proline iminopeptidase
MWCHLRLPSLLACAAMALAACSERPPAERAAADTAARADADVPSSREAYALTPDSVRLWYRVVGNGRETVLVGAANYFVNSLDSLVTAERRVVYYDLRGRGRTDSVPPAKMGIVEFDAEDIDVIRRAVGAETVTLVGWSGGVLAAFRYALRHPDRVSRLVMITPVGPRWIPYWDDMRRQGAARVDTAERRRLAERVQRGEFAGNEVALCRAQARIGLRTNWPDSTQWLRAPDVCDSPNELPSRYDDFVPRLLNKLGKYDWRGDLANMPVPTLVLHGALDNPPLEGSQEWVAGMPKARLYVMQGVGHWPHYERPAETLHVLRTFLDGGWPAGSEPKPDAP